MSAAQHAPKLWLLTDSETINSFETWRQNLLYILYLDDKFITFLSTSWSKKTAQSPTHGLTSDGDTVPEGFWPTAAQKNRNLELMLWQIVNFCPGIARNTFLKDATSFYDVWQKIRLHLGFQCMGAHFLDLANIRLEPNERPKTLYRRLNAFFQDNLLLPRMVFHIMAPLLLFKTWTPLLKTL